jgi:hypothetical protein
MERKRLLLTGLISTALLTTATLGKPTTDFLSMATENLYLYEKIGKSITLWEKYNAPVITPYTEEENKKIVEKIKPEYIPENYADNMHYIENQIRIVKNGISTKIPLRIENKNYIESLKLDRDTLSSLIESSTSEKEKNIDITKKTVNYLKENELKIITINMPGIPTERTIIDYLESQNKKDINKEESKSEETTYFYPPDLDSLNKVATNLIVLSKEKEMKDKICKIAKGMLYLGIPPEIPPAIATYPYRKEDMIKICKEEIGKMLKNYEKNSLNQQDRYCLIYYNQIPKLEKDDENSRLFQKFAYSNPLDLKKLFQQQTEIIKECNDPKLLNTPKIYHQETPVNLPI